MFLTFWEVSSGFKDSNDIFDIFDIFDIIAIRTIAQRRQPCPTY